MKRNPEVLKPQHKDVIVWVVVLTIAFLSAIMWVNYQKLQEKYNQLRLRYLETAEQTPATLQHDSPSDESRATDEIFKNIIIDYKAEIENLRNENQELRKQLNEYVGRWMAAQIIQVEGLEANHPADPGGYTRFGISSKIHGFVPQNYQQAVQFYLDNFWYGMRLNELSSSKLQFALMDAAVLFGAPYVSKLLTKLLNVQTYEQAIEKIRSWKDDDQTTIDLIEQLKKSLNYRIKELTKNNNRLKVFVAGWQNRINRY